MSDWRRKEERVRKVFSKKFNTTFRKRKLLIGYRSDGTPREHEFDMVSVDEKS